VGHFAVNFGNIGQAVVLEMGKAPFPRVEKAIQMIHDGDHAPVGYRDAFDGSLIEKVSGDAFEKALVHTAKNNVSILRMVSLLNRADKGRQVRGAPGSCFFADGIPGMAFALFNRYGVYEIAYAPLRWQRDTER
jgi:hypothetical protein